MGEYALPCIVCRKRLLEVQADFTENQAEDGNRFVSRGQYGSTVFDPMDGSHVEVNICDDCLVKAGERGDVLSGKNYREVHCYPDDNHKAPMVVGKEYLDRPLVPWTKGLAGYDDDDVLEVDIDDIGTDMGRTVQWMPSWRSAQQSLWRSS